METLTHDLIFWKTTAIILIFTWVAAIAFTFLFFVLAFKDSKQQTNP